MAVCWYKDILNVYQCTLFINNGNFSWEDIFYIMTTVLYCHSLSTHGCPQGALQILKNEWIKTSDYTCIIVCYKPFNQGLCCIEMLNSGTYSQVFPLNQSMKATNAIPTIFTTVAIMLTLVWKSCSCCGMVDFQQLPLASTWRSESITFATYWVDHTCTPPMSHCSRSQREKRSERKPTSASSSMASGVSDYDLDLFHSFHYAWMELL